MLSECHCRKLRAWVFIVVTLFIFHGCQPANELRLKIGSSVSPSSEILYLARDLGYLDDLPVDLIALSSDTDVLSALRNRTLEAAALTLDETISGLDEGIEMKVVLLMGLSDGTDCVLGHPRIESLADLKGKTVAVEANASGALLLQNSLESVGLSVSDISVISCPGNEHVECFAEVDAIVTSDPARTKILNLGAVELSSSKAFPGRIVDVLVLAVDDADKYQAILGQLARAYYRALEYLVENSDQAALMMGQRFHLTPEESLKVFDGIRLPYVDFLRPKVFFPPSVFNDLAESLTETMLENNLITSDHDLSRLTDMRIYPPIHLK